MLFLSAFFTLLLFLAHLVARYLRPFPFYICEAGTLERAATFAPSGVRSFLFLRKSLCLTGTFRFIATLAP